MSAFHRLLDPDGDGLRYRNEDMDSSRKVSDPRVKTFGGKPAREVRTTFEVGGEPGTTLLRDSLKAFTIGELDMEMEDGTTIRLRL